MSNAFYWYRPDNILPELNGLYICYLDTSNRPDCYIPESKPTYKILKFDVSKSEWLMQDMDGWIPCMNNIIGWMPLECPFK